MIRVPHSSSLAWSCPIQLSPIFCVSVYFSISLPCFFVSLIVALAPLNSTLPHAPQNNKVGVAAVVRRVEKKRFNWRKPNLYDLLFMLLVVKVEI